ncbi:hypothetical protein E6Q11_02565 [Candidatus Dojkabacteria bacterium]|uniref:Uncharacterized protein n=1 Tax=Candidatus Dojkabacteria bacterium TaxID=2099670 RepID=A0A5C7J9I2_9BACT|nr:MAG: hypothetical protein E6Q11_02565 [Candidatus Dojkabacteria bacterium]
MSFINLSNDNGLVGPGTSHQPWRGEDGTGYVRLSDSWDAAEQVTKIAMLRWDTDTLSWVKFSGDSSGIAADVTVLNWPASLTGAAINTSYVSGTITVGTSEIEAKVGGSALTGRQLLSIENQTGADIFYGPTGVTTSTGHTIAARQEIFLSVGPSIGVFLIKASGSGTVRIQEYA